MQKFKLCCSLSRTARISQVESSCGHGGHYGIVLLSECLSAPSLRVFLELADTTSALGCILLASPSFAESGLDDNAAALVNQTVITHRLRVQIE